MKTLIEAHSSGQERLKRYANSDYILKNCLSSIWESYEASAWYYGLIENDELMAKQYFNNCGFVDLEECLFNKDIFGYKLNSPIYAALSDNIDLINQFANADYIIQSGPNNKKTFKEIAKIGESHIYIDTIIKSMNKDHKGLSLNIQSMKDVFIKKKKNAVFAPDMNFFEGIIKNDKDKIFKSIQLLATTWHSSRNKHSSIYQNFVSQPAMGYAKIAWINGFELEFNSPLIHNHLLPLKALPKYSNDLLLLKKVMTYEPTNSDYNGRKIIELTQNNNVDLDKSQVNPLVIENDQVLKKPNLKSLVLMLICFVLASSLLFELTSSAFPNIDPTQGTTKGKLGKLLIHTFSRIEGTPLGYIIGILLTVIGVFQLKSNIKSILKKGI
ncbi:immunity 49 family protein [Fulvivirga lutea]|uniref:Immunity 49 family protein n=1 Tax=Fulvivirga lutea TaxID=2810512 RepID=A0A974WIL8_9BACT|nr:immunity 49 family protein [Fulvivirga lutea]QSE98850.1 immunity 49 family protein [Fulvivirga lutea]